jgi:hypothetical protein
MNTHAFTPFFYMECIGGNESRQSYITRVKYKKIRNDYIT